MAVELDGPRLEPRSGTARQLVVFLHGYGADGNDLIEIGRAWQRLLAGRRVRLAARAATLRPGAGRARNGFALTFRDPNERWVGVTRRAPMLERFSTPNLRAGNLPPSALALVGFSQGTMMALHVGLRRAVAPAAIVGYSGMLVCRLTPTRKRSPPRSNPGRRCCWSMAIKTSSFRRRRCSSPPRHSPRSASRPNGTSPPEVGHGIDQEGLRQGGEFLARHFAPEHEPNCG